MWRHIRFVVFKTLVSIFVLSDRTQQEGRAREIEIW